MEISGIISALIVGVIVGVLGRLAVPGKQAISIWITILIGIVAAFIGTAIVGPLRDTDGVDWIEIIVQVALAAVGVALAAKFMPSRDD